MKKIITTGLTILFAGLLFAGCVDTDVVLKYSPASLDAVVAAFPDITKPADPQTHYADLTVDGVTTLKVSDDFSRTGKDDIMIETPLKPFTDAGLDVSKLGAGYKTDGDLFYLTADYGDGTGAKGSIRDSIFDAVKSNRSLLTYHQALDHYGVKLPAGKFEWAKDYQKNDKDVVFAIYAKPLSDIGVNVQNVDGWTFKTMQDENGNDVDMLLKPYDLKS
jgi:hypothetical protein